jgi:hypothetical protein
MTPKLYFILICLWTATAYSQTHFTKFKSPNYKTVSVQFGSMEDSSRLDIINVSRIEGMKDLKIHLLQITNDSSEILIYRNNKLIQEIPLPFMFWQLNNECLVADLDNNQKPDIKLMVYGNGAGLASELAYKIYLFNQGTRFKLLSFFDFSHEKEYDLNNDGVYEILSCDHVYKGGHSYWVYNAFDFKGGKLKNISKTFSYPLWTKHLYASRNMIADISKKEREKQFRALPGEAVIK